MSVVERKFDKVEWEAALGILGPHGFTTRFGGVSTQANASLNLALNDRDTMENVEKHLHNLGHAPGFDPEPLVMTRQPHSDIVRVVTKKDHISLCRLIFQRTAANGLY